MLLPRYIVLENRTKLNSALANLRKSHDLIDFRRRALTYIADIRTGLKELSETISSSYDQLYLMASNLKSTVEAIEEETPVVDILTATQEFLNNCTNFMEEHQDDFSSLKNNIYRYARDDGYTEIPEHIVMKIGSMIQETHRTVNAFDVSVFNCNTLRYLKNHYTNKKMSDTLITHSISTGEGLNNQIRENCDKAAFGLGNGVKITNNAFDILFIRPKLMWELNNLTARISLTDRKEKKSINYNLKYVRPDGIIVLALPYYRLYNDMKVLISKNMKDVIIFKDINDTSAVPRIYIIGRKKTGFDIDTITYETLKETINSFDIPTFAEMNGSFELPNDEIEIESFRGSLVTDEDVEAVFRNTVLFSNMIEKELDQTNHDLEKRPLLPFNIGQIGLVLTSGCLDGVVQENDGTCHIIKGRVKKQISRDTEIDEHDSTATVTETISNKVEISVMLANGMYKILA